MEEKIRTHFIEGSNLANAGIHIVGPEIFRGVPAHTRIDMPEPLEGEIANRRREPMFPIHEYRLDIGRMDDFERAQTDFHALGLTWSRPPRA